MAFVSVGHLRKGNLMLVLVGAFLVSLIPSLAIFFWMRTFKDDETYRSNCNKALQYGLCSILPTMLFSFVFNLIESLSGMRSASPLAAAAFHDFFVFALCEEVAKFLTFRFFVKKTPYPYSWLDLIVAMVTVGIGFELLEGLVYAFGTGVPHMLVRGITAMHVVYAFIMGYLYGKAQHTGQKGYLAIAIGLPWLMHGTYDFCISEELTAINDTFAMVSLLLAVISFVLLVVMVVFMRKARGQSIYTTPL